jgi:hypothetical protein
MLSLILFILLFALSIGILGFIFSLHKPDPVKVLSKKKQKRAQRALYFKQKLRLPKPVAELNPLEIFVFSPYGFGLVLFLAIDLIATVLLTQESSYYDHISGNVHFRSITILVFVLGLSASCYKSFISQASSPTTQLPANQSPKPQLSAKQRLSRMVLLLGCIILIFFSCRSISQDITNLIQGPQYASGIISNLSFTSSRSSARLLVEIGNNKYKVMYKEWPRQVQTQKGQKIDYIHDPSHKLIYPLHDPQLSSIGLSLVIFHSLIWLLLLGFTIRGYLFLFRKKPSILK